MEIGVHIADVSYYVDAGTLLDKAAYERGCSVYLPDRTVPMFPEKLSNFLCSLRPREDKLCVSAVLSWMRTSVFLPAGLAERSSVPVAAYRMNKHSLCWMLQAGTVLFRKTESSSLPGSTTKSRQLRRRSTFCRKDLTIKCVKR